MRICIYVYRRRQWHPLQYSCLGNPMGGGAWWATVHGVAESETTERLHFHFALSCTEEGNGTLLLCSCLENARDCGAWWAAVYGSHRVRHDWSDSSNSSSNFPVIIERSHPERRASPFSPFACLFLSFQFNLPCSLAEAFLP